MKKWNMAFVFMLLLTLGTKAQLNKTCVVQLRNGSNIKGKITNVVPHESVTIITPQNHQFVIYAENIAKLRRLGGGLVNWDLGRVAIQFSPVGFVQLGPAIQFETGIKGNTFVGSHMRFSNIKSWYEDASDKLPNRMPPSEIAAGISITRFFNRIASPNKYYLSLILEYSQGKSSGLDISSRNWSGENAEVNILIGIGHRWRFSSGWFLNLGLVGGISKGIKDQWRYDFEPERVFEKKSKMYFPGMVQFAFGWELNKQ